MKHYNIWHQLSWAVWLLFCNGIMVQMPANENVSVLNQCFVWCFNKFKEGFAHDIYIYIYIYITLLAILNHLNRGRLCALAIYGYKSMPDFACSQKVLRRFDFTIIRRRVERGSYYWRWNQVGNTMQRHKNWYTKTHSDDFHYSINMSLG